MPHCHKCNENKPVVFLSGYVSTHQDDANLKHPLGVSENIRKKNIKHFTVYESDIILARNHHIVVLCNCGKEVARLFRFGLVHFKDPKTEETNPKNFTLNIKSNKTGENNPDEEFKKNIRKGKIRIDKPLFIYSLGDYLFRRDLGVTHETFLKEDSGDLDYVLFKYYTNFFTDKTVHHKGTITPTEADVKSDGKKLNTKSNPGVCCTVQFIMTNTPPNIDKTSPGIKWYNSTFVFKPAGNNTFDIQKDNPNMYPYDTNQNVMKNLIVQAFMIKYVPYLNQYGDEQYPHWSFALWKPSGSYCQYSFSGSSGFFSPGQSMKHYFTWSNDPNNPQYNMGNGTNVGEPDTNGLKIPWGNLITVWAILGSDPYIGKGSTCLGGTSCMGNNSASNFYTSGVAVDPSQLLQPSDPSDQNNRFGLNFLNKPPPHPWRIVLDALLMTIQTVLTDEVLGPEGDIILMEVNLAKPDGSP